MILSYARVSTVEQGVKGGKTACPDQIRRNRAIADLRGIPHSDIAEFVDDGVSGTIPLGLRAAGRQMLAQAKAGDCIVANKLDRLFRSACDALNTAEKLKARGVDLILIDMGIEPVTSNGAAKLFFGMLACIAEFERDRIGERIAEGRRAKAERAGHIGGDAPYGYAIEGTGKSATLVPVEHEQEVVRMARAMRSNMKPGKITRALNEMGRRSRLGSPFEIYQVMRIVSTRCSNSRRRPRDVVA